MPSTSGPLPGHDAASFGRGSSLSRSRSWSRSRRRDSQCRNSRWSDVSLTSAPQTCSIVAAEPLIGAYLADCLPDAAASACRPHRYLVISAKGVAVRSGLELSSAKVTAIPSSTIIEVLERATNESGAVRLRVADGWISEFAVSDRTRLVVPATPEPPSWAKGFDGTWKVSSGKKVLIERGELIGSEDFQVVDYSTCSAELHGKIYHGEFVDNEIRWSDGDVWQSIPGKDAGEAPVSVQTRGLPRLEADASVQRAPEWFSEVALEVPEALQPPTLRSSTGNRRDECLTLSKSATADSEESLRSLVTVFFGKVTAAEALSVAQSIIRLAHSRTTAAAANPRHRAGACGAAGGAVVLGGTGGAAGLTVGGALGALCGAVPALFTFGLSIPAGAVLGGGAGLCVGTAVGGATGIAVGAAAGYQAHDAQEQHHQAIESSPQPMKALTFESETTASEAGSEVESA